MGLRKRSLTFCGARCAGKAQFFCDSDCLFAIFIQTRNCSKLEDHVFEVPLVLNTLPFPDHTERVLNGVYSPFFFLGYLENKMFQFYHVVPEIYVIFFRYINDILGITRVKQDAPHNWIGFMQHLHPSTDFLYSGTLKLHCWVLNSVTFKATLSPQCTISLRTPTPFYGMIPSTLSHTKTLSHSPKAAIPFTKGSYPIHPISYVYDALSPAKKNIWEYLIK